MIICSPYINLSTTTLFSFSILLTWTQCIWHRSFICTYILLLCDADVLSNQITYICHTHTVLYTLMVTISFYWNAYKAHILLLIDFSLSKLVNHTQLSRTKWTNGYHYQIFYRHLFKPLMMPSISTLMRPKYILSNANSKPLALHNLHVL